MKKMTLALATACALTFTTQAQQLKVPAPSPTQTLKQNFGLADITIEYSRPSAKGRVVFGDVVPFGKIWRTGANASTKITFGDDVTFQGEAVKAGTYAIYTVPNKDEWEIMLYKDLTLGGNVAGYKTDDEVLRVKVKVTRMTQMVETFTINVNNITPSTATIDFCWEKTCVSVKVATNIDERIMKNIETAVSTDSRPYFQAANYYYENDKDLGKALEWVNKAIEQNPKAFYMVHLKAKILLKQKDYKSAITTAEESRKLAEEAQNDDYVRMNDKLIEQAKKGK
jgi:hypothetical protein